MAMRGRNIRGEIHCVNEIREPKRVCYTHGDGVPLRRGARSDGLWAQARPHAYGDGAYEGVQVPVRDDLVRHGMQ